MNEENSQEQIKFPSKKVSTREDSFILLMLDALFDTRIGTIAKHDTALASRVLSSGNYFKRETDEFEDITVEKFKELYAKRDVETLKLSIVTNMVFLLQRIVKDAMCADSMAPNDEKLIIHLNIWPYDNLNQDEIDMFRDCLRYYTYSYPEIVVISAPLDTLTPEYCKENYDIMIMYDYETYLETHLEALQKLQMPQVSLIGPQMCRCKKFDEEAEEEIKKMNIDRYRAMEIGMTPIVALKLMPVSLYCISEQINPSNKDKILNDIKYTIDDITNLMSAVNNVQIDDNVFDDSNHPNFKDIINKDEDEML